MGKLGKYIIITATITLLVPIVAFGGTSKVTLQLDNNVAYVDGKPVRLEAAPTVINGRTLVPLRFIVEATGGEVGWNGETKTITITREVPDLVFDKFGDDTFYKLVEESDKSILIQTQDFGADERLTNSLMSAAKRGVTVKIIIDGKSVNPDFTTEPELEDAGCMVRWDTSESGLGRNFAIFDDESVMLGSHTWTKEINKDRKELSLCYKNELMANDLTLLFEHDWIEPTTKQSPQRRPNHTFKKPENTVWEHGWEKKHILASGISGDDVLMVYSTPLPGFHPYFATFIDARNGNELEEKRNMLYGYTPIVYEDCFILCEGSTFDEFEFVCQNPRTGNERWRVNLNEKGYVKWDGLPYSHIKRFDERLYVELPNSIAIIDLENGKLIDTPEYIESIPIYLKGNILCQHINTDSESRITCHNTETGELLWEIDSANTVAEKGNQSDKPSNTKYLTVDIENGNITSIDIATGEIAFQLDYTVDTLRQIDFLQSENTLYVNTDKLKAYDIELKELLWQSEIQIESDGLLFANSNSLIVCSYEEPSYYLTNISAYNGNKVWSNKLGRDKITRDTLAQDWRGNYYLPTPTGVTKLD